MDLDWQAILQYSFWGNSIKEYLYAWGLFVILMVILRIFRSVILARLKKFALMTTTKLDDYLVEAFERAHPQFYDFIALFIAIHSLKSIPSFDKALNGLFLAVVVYQVIQSSQSLIKYFLHKLLKDEDDNEADQTALYGVLLLINIGLWATGLLVVLSNLGINVTSLAASLGIGGIAVALAVQNILGDVFSSFSIYFDKPFAIGDFIIVGEHMGTVEKIGMKTTRLKALQGEEIVISNNELTSARIQNFKKMDERRVMFEIGVTYDTTLEQCKNIPGILGKIFGEFDNLTLDRATFREFADFSLIYEIVYYHSTGDYKEYMLEREALNLRIKEEFENADIDMAFPTQTLILEKN